MSHSPDSHLESARLLLERAATRGFIDREDARLPSSGAPLDETLRRAAHELNRLLTATSTHGSPVALAELQEMSLELALIRNSLLSRQLAQRHELLARVDDSLQRLYSAESAAELLARLPREVVRLGYVRALYSNIEDLRWVAHSAHSINGPQESTLLVEIGKRPPFEDMRPLLEYEMVRNRRPVIFHNVNKSPQAHPTLIQVTQSESMVAAPLVAGKAIRGFVSIDARADTGTVEEFDRDALNLLCSGAGLLLDRLHLSETRMALRNGSPLEPGTPEPDFQLVDGRPYFEVLTKRENELLELLSAGLTNRQMAEHFFVSEDTVKSHVKSILRKFGVTNRTGAAKLYHHAFG